MPNSLTSVATSCTTTSNAERLRKTKNGGVATKLPHQVLRRNERERKRVQQVNLGFINLRDRVPQSSSSKKLSKVETLREAARYIRHLQELLRMSCDKPFEPLHSESETHSYQTTPTTSQENYYSPPPPISECTYQAPIYEQQYYLAYPPAPYCNSAYGTSFQVIKSEDTSPDSSCTSEASVDDYRLHQKNYIL